MHVSQYLVHSCKLQGDSGELVSFSRNDAGWEWMSFCVRRLAPGEVWRIQHPGEESIQVLFSGTCGLSWASGSQKIGTRENVFNGLPYAFYLAGTKIAVATVESWKVLSKLESATDALKEYSAARERKMKDTSFSFSGQLVFQECVGRIIFSLN
jgi:5-deoxy-D-glucuronate isomerase